MNNAHSNWTYTEIEILDADRLLRPTHICSTEIRFAEPPGLTSDIITITTHTGDRKITHQARVLAHQSNATHIPIELIVTSSASNAPAKLTA